MVGPEPSVHDNVIYAYSVSCEERVLILHTAFRDREPQELTDIVFHDVVAHHFEHVLEGNILFDVEDMEVAALVRDNTNVFADSWRYGWPAIEYRGDLDTLVRALQGAGIHAYAISSSYGLSGWVLARNCQRLLRHVAARLTDTP